MGVSFSNNIIHMRVGGYKKIHSPRENTESVHTFRVLFVCHVHAPCLLSCAWPSAFTTATPITSFPPNAHTSKAHPTELLLGAFAYVCLVTCVSKSLRSVSPTTTTPSSLFCFAAGTCPASTFRSEDLPLRKQQCGDGGGGKDTKKIPNSGQRR